MSFASRVKGKEMACIVRILEIFGVVEQRQMRELFSRLSDDAYGKILSHLNSDGLVYWAKDGVRLAASRLALERTDFDASVMCFWAFVKMKDKIEDFCSGDPPALITVTTGANTVDLIPLTPENTDEINRNMEEMPEETKRFLVTRDPQLVSGVQRRYKNDYVLHVDSCGNIETYEL